MSYVNNISNCSWCNAPYRTLSGPGLFCSYKCQSEALEKTAQESAQREMRAKQAETERRHQLKAAGWSDERIDEHDRQVAQEKARAEELKREKAQQEQERRARKEQAERVAYSRRAIAALVLGGIPGGVALLFVVDLHGSWFSNSNIGSTVVIFGFGAVVSWTLTFIFFNTVLGQVKDE